MHFVRIQEVKLAVDLYISAGEWTTFSHYGLNEQMAMESLFASNSCWRYIIEGEDVIGIVGLERINPLDKVAEPCMAILPNKQRKGFGLKAFQKLCFGLGVNEIGLRRLQATILSDSPSHKLLDKSGFKCEGVLKKLRFKNGEFIDGLLYAWVKGEN